MTLFKPIPVVLFESVTVALLESDTGQPPLLAARRTHSIDTVHRVYPWTITQSPPVVRVAPTAVLIAGNHQYARSTGTDVAETTAIKSG